MKTATIDIRIYGSHIKEHNKIAEVKTRQLFVLPLTVVSDVAFLETIRQQPRSTEGIQLYSIVQ